ncbi:MAG: CPBP family intramembrane metalloprotease [Proteobacteria bacterium]|nr:CPBP family intramembrane metalloprotease [Pseudomonadota bacterium]
MSDKPPVPGFLVGVIYLAVSVAFVCGLQGLMVIPVLLSGGSSDWMFDPVFLGLGSLLQTGGLVGIAVVVAWATKRDFATAFAVRGARVGAFAGALIVGLSAGLFAGWISELATEYLQFLPGMDPAHFEMIADAMLEGHILKRIFFIAVVVLAAPLFEEIIFRGMLWDSFEESAGSWAAWLITSLLFAGYHVVPIHVISVFSTGAFIGLLRLYSQSLWPAIFAHFLNNSLAVGLVLAMGEEANDFETAIWLAAIGLFASLAGIGVAYGVGRPRLLEFGSRADGTEDTDGIE